MLHVSSGQVSLLQAGVVLKNTPPFKRDFHYTSIIHRCEVRNHL